MHSLSSPHLCKGHDLLRPLLGVWLILHRYEAILILHNRIKKSVEGDVMDLTRPYKVNNRHAGI